MEPLLVVEGLTKSSGGLKAVRAFNCRVNQRTVHALIGPNGAGKTTVFNLISGLLKPDAGRIRLEGRELTGLPAHMVSRAGIGRTFQTIRVFRDLTAEENVLVGLYAHSGVSVVRSALRPPVDRKLRREVEAALELVGLAPSAGTLARNLSYGEQKRLVKGPWPRSTAVKAGQRPHLRPEGRRRVGTRRGYVCGRCQGTEPEDHPHSLRHLQETSAYKCSACGDGLLRNCCHDPGTRRVGQRRE